MREHKIQITVSILLMLVLCIIFPKNTMAETLYIDPKADVTFVIDATGSMGKYIAGVKENLSAFITQVSNAKVDVRMRFVVYRDITCDEDTVCSAWIDSAEDAQTYLDAIVATGGGDGPETLLDGMGAMLTDSFGFRENAAKFCIALTDAKTKLMNSYGFMSEDQVVNNLKTRGIITSIISNQGYESLYSKYVTEDLGIFADISGDYSIVLKKLGDVVINGANKFSTTGISPAYTTEGIATVVTVYGSELTYADDFTVYLDSKKMAVNKKTDCYFEFSVPSTMKVGSYDVNVENDETVSKVGRFSVVKAIKPVGKMTMTPNTSVEGTTTTVKVTCPNMSYATDFAIKLGNVNMSISYKGSSYFKFVVPASLPAKKYTVTMINDGIESNLGEYTVTEKPEPNIEMTMNQTTSKEGTAATVKVSITGGTLSYKDFYVKLGSTKMNVTYSGSTYFKFAIPSTVAEGTYAVTVGNEGKEYGLGDYVVTAKPAPPAVTMTMNQTTSQEGTASTVKVAVTGGTMKYETDFNVKLGDTKLAIVYQGDTYFRFTVPASAKKGTYIVSVMNGGSSKEIGTYVIKEKVVPEPTFGEMSVTSAKSSTQTKVKVTYSNMTYASDFNIEIGDTKVAIAYKGSSYFRFYTPVGKKPGTYDVTVTNGGKKYVIGTIMLQ